MLFNLRFGLATNSSSSHSIIWLPEHDVEDCLIDGPECFGWSFWTAASKETKLKYAGYLLASAWARIVSPGIAKVIVKDWLGADVRLYDTGGEGWDGYIDHQSQINIPCEFGKTTPSKQFAKELAEYLAQGEVVILGGNDNTGEYHPLWSEEAETGVRRHMPTDGYMMTCRKDPQHGYWTVFCPQDGTKWRFHFGGGKVGDVPDKSSTPELVDIKITDRCKRGCSFCYQDSTVKGEHAKEDHLRDLVRALKDMKVFEVALGGGEPTQHPGFWDLLEDFRDNSIVPNFTTRDAGWLRDPDKVARFRAGPGDFAFSVQNPGEVVYLKDLSMKAGVEDRVALQLVMGTMTREDFVRTLELAKEHWFRVTLLGYKTVGRGHGFKPMDCDWWLDACAELAGKGKLPRLGIDTALAAQYEDVIQEAGIPRWLWSKDEGKHSMYIDAVEGKMGASSYVAEEDLVPLDLGDEGYCWDRQKKYKESIVSAFERW